DEMQIDVHHVVDMNEVAHLSAVIVTVPAAEQAHVAVLYELIEVVEGYRRHATFVLFLRPIHVEVTQTDHRRSQVAHATPQHLIEQVLGIAIDIEWRFIGRVFHVDGARAVHRGGRSVHEGNAPLLAQLEELERDPIVVVEHVVPIALGRVRTGALVQHDLHVGNIPLSNPQSEIVLVLVVGNFAAHQVAKLVALGKVVDHQDVGITATIQATDQIAADESGAAGNHDHESSPAVTTEVPSLPTTMPPARLAQPTDSSQLSPAARATASVARTVSPAPDTSKTSCACASI